MEERREVDRLLAEEFSRQRQNGAGQAGDELRLRWHVEPVAERVHRCVDERDEDGATDERNARRREAAERVPAAARRRLLTDLEEELARDPGAAGGVEKKQHVSDVPVVRRRAVWTAVRAAARDDDVRVGNAVADFESEVAWTVVVCGGVVLSDDRFDVVLQLWFELHEDGSVEVLVLAIDAVVAVVRVRRQRDRYRHVLLEADDHDDQHDPEEFRRVVYDGREERHQRREKGEYEEDDR